MLENSCKKFIEDLSSKQPVPGGGGASALVGAIGMALGMMVGNLTIGKPKYAKVQDEMQALLEASKNSLEGLELLVQKDASAFAPLAVAYGLSSDTEEEKQTKQKKTQEALILAIETPIEVLEEACKALGFMKTYAVKGSTLVLSDAGVGAACLKAAILSAKLNVQINLNLLKDTGKKELYYHRMNRLVENGTALADEIYTYVENRLQEDI
ncbi:cyclodeaminase/cyclohydrolase family protein [Sinanaerobacter sp. ZZT-01]|uniref:cyclodeaminase/cyclohydrolase family protein n=1 Tax=Sinanaerobacter sp. ZZT-01 TaxID=3111540 RepID=UPI002D76B204|nr:cyclodeaminase/cyclohydrolase family protein [Sinanaerobacter sp. ZZT-01]WRR93205.1 cyclodeaminase/cyclohydrolase family protein [Sinanaerobacter sp. ZZT-01]